MRDFARYIVASGAATDDQVAVALERQRAQRPTIGRVALNQGLLDGAQIFTILAFQTRNPTMRFGEAAIALGMLSPRHIEELLSEQRTRTPPLEELLVRAGALDEATARSLRASYDGEPTEIAPRSVPRPSGTRLAVNPCKDAPDNSPLRRTAGTRR